MRPNGGLSSASRRRMPERWFFPEKAHGGLSYGNAGHPHRPGEGMGGDRRNRPNYRKAPGHPDQPSDSPSRGHRSIHPGRMASGGLFTSEAQPAFFRHRPDHQRPHVRAFVEELVYTVFGTSDVAILALKKGSIDMFWWPIQPGYLNDLSGRRRSACLPTKRARCIYRVQPASTAV
jgi:hypothetical protein